MKANPVELAATADIGRASEYLPLGAVALPTLALAKLAKDSRLSVGDVVGVISGWCQTVFISTPILLSMSLFGVTLLLDALFGVGRNVVEGYPNCARFW